MEFKRPLLLGVAFFCLFSSARYRQPLGLEDLRTTHGIHERDVCLAVGHEKTRDGSNGADWLGSKTDFAKVARLSES